MRNEELFHWTEFSKDKQQAEISELEMYGEL